MSGLTSARILNMTCEMTLFDKNQTVGGNAHAVQLPKRGMSIAVDGVVECDAPFRKRH
jgi:predicted NAD/FAD-binding protein